MLQLLVSFVLFLSLSVSGVSATNYPACTDTNQCNTCSTLSRYACSFSNQANYWACCPDGGGLACTCGASQPDTCSCSEQQSSCVVNYCTSHPCQNGGTCTNSANGYSCSCLNNYSGINCQNAPVNYCAATPGPCLNGGTCNGAFNSYTCSCVGGYTGINCQTAPSTAGSGTSGSTCSSSDSGTSSSNPSGGSSTSTTSSTSSTDAATTCTSDGTCFVESGGVPSNSSAILSQGCSCICCSGSGCTPAYQGHANQVSSAASCSASACTTAYPSSCPTSQQAGFAFAAYTKPNASYRSGPNFLFIAFFITIGVFYLLH